MGVQQWTLIVALGAAAFGLRFLGLIAGARRQRLRFAPLLDDLPGLIIVSLVASALAGKPLITWVAAGIAMGVAMISNSVVLTMTLGVVAFALLTQFGGF